MNAMTGALRTRPPTRPSKTAAVLARLLRFLRRVCRASIEDRLRSFSGTGGTSVWIHCGMGV